MAGGTYQPGTGAPEQTQQPYGYQQPMGYAQPQYAQPQPTDFGQTLRKLFLIVAIFVGALLILFGRVLIIYQSGNVGLGQAGALLEVLGAFGIGVPSAIWAIGSKRTTDMQNVGLLILAAFMIAYFA